MIDHLNATVWAKIAPSPIHGVGVFAIRDIPKGQCFYYGLYESFPKQNVKEWLFLSDWAGLHPAIRKLIEQRWPLACDEYGKGVVGFLSPNDDAVLTSFLNHSETPNIDRGNNKALRDIKEGEELTEDYRGLGALGDRLYPFLVDEVK